MFNSNFKVTQGQMGLRHLTRHIWFPFDIYSNRMSVFRRLATRNVFSSLSIRPKLWKVESAPNDLKMTLNATRSKVPRIFWTTTHESQISLRFALRSLVFQIIEVLDISICYNGELDTIEKKTSLKLRNSKFLWGPFLVLKFLWGPLGENSGQVSKLLAAICRRSSVLKFSLP